MVSALARRPLWIITCYRNNRMEVLTVDPDGDGGSLPVFSFKEEAKTFLGLSENDQEEGSSRWRIRETTAGELVSVLLAPCAEVRQVALDPMPLPLSKLICSFCTIARERFVENLLMGRRRELTGELAPA
jgi:hypothetical protein